MAQQPIVNYFLPPSIQFGAGAIKNLGAHVGNFRGKKPLIVTDEGVTNAGILSKAVEPLENTQIDCAIFDAVQPNPTDLSVLEGLEVYRAEGCDAVIAVGGGSVMDAAKAIRILTTHEPPLENYYVDVGGINWISSNLPALICIPTTAGTGSELSQGSIITDTSGRTTVGHRKRAISTPYNMASLALLDPELTVGMPPGLTAATGMDAVTHGVEAYVATRYHPIAEGVALQALKILGKNIRQAYHHGERCQGTRRNANRFRNGGVLISERTGCCAFARASALNGSQYPPRNCQRDLAAGGNGVQPISRCRWLRRHRRSVGR